LVNYHYAAIREFEASSVRKRQLLVTKLTIGLLSRHNANVIKLFYWFTLSLSFSLSLSLLSLVTSLVLSLSSPLLSFVSFFSLSYFSPSLPLLYLFPLVFSLTFCFLSLDFVYLSLSFFCISSYNKDKLSQQDKTRAEFSTLEVAIFMLCIYGVVK
jgi:hypothetical protein